MKATKKISICVFAVTGLFLCGCASQRVELFNGKNLDGWRAFTPDGIAPEAIWSVNDGVLQCKGQPHGYLRTVDEYRNYTLFVQWRWTDKPTNSGVLLHTTGEDKIWPLCIEAQLMHEHAGDFVTIQNGSQITVDGTVHQPPADRIYQIVAKQKPSSENPAGQWNTYKIVCRSNTVDLYVNGVHQNSAVDVTPECGSICLQSEGLPIEFRSIYLIPF